MTACSDSPDGESGGDVKTAAVIKGLDNPFFQAMKQGIEAESKAGGGEVTVQAANSITDTTGQADKLDALALQDYGCYLVNPISGTNLTQSLAKVSANDKPIVNIDSPVDASAAKRAKLDIATYIGTDNVAAGRLAGKEMLKHLDSGDQVALVGGIAGDVTSQARLTGFKQAVRGKLEVKQTVAADWDRQKALTDAQDIMRGNSGIKGFFVANDDMGLGVSRAVANAGKTGDVDVISVDGIEDGLEGVKDGKLTASVAQYPYTMGTMGMEACAAAAAGKKLPKQVDAPVQLVTEDTADKALKAFPKPFQPYDDPFRDKAD
ncbi:MAG: substrate-binding domain-containing protein [Streptosporangiales bacterium]|nr:substrate-binding domain-containing protein [Streptosporangiales bacterium]